MKLHPEVQNGVKQFNVDKSLRSPRKLPATAPSLKRIVNCYGGMLIAVQRMSKSVVCSPCLRAEIPAVLQQKLLVESGTSRFRIPVPAA